MISSRNNSVWRGRGRAC